MSGPERIYHGSTRAISVVFVLLGIFLLVRTLIAGGGPASVGMILGVVFIAIGAGRFWISTRMG